MSDEPPRTAFILNMDANGLGVARTLGRQGIPTVGMDNRPWIPGLRSKYVRPLECPDVTEDPEGVLDRLLKEGQELGDRGVLFPTSDAFVLFASRHRNQLASCFDFMIPSENMEELIVNKRMQYAEARRLGIPTADVFYPRSLDDLDEIPFPLHFPVFIKPIYSHLWRKEFPNKGLIARDHDELREKLMKVFATDLEIMVQSIMTPPSKDLYSVGAYFGRDGYVSPTIIWHKIRQYPPNFGVGSLVESAHQPEVEELGLRYMRGLGYRGIGYVEFKKDQMDGKWKIIELNPRTGQTNALQTAAGMPLALIEYKDLTGGTLPSVRDYRDGVLWWNSLDDLDSYWRLRRRGELTFGQWVHSWLNCDVHAYYSPEDIGPVLRRYGYGLELARLMGRLLRMKEDEDQSSG